MLRINHDNFDALLICMVPPALECTVELKSIIIELLIHVTIIHDMISLYRVPPGHQTLDPGPPALPPCHSPWTSDMGPTHHPGPPPLLTSGRDHHWTADLFKLVHLKTSLKTSRGGGEGGDIWC